MSVEGVNGTGYPDSLSELIARCEAVMESASPRAKMAFGAAMWQLVRGAGSESVPASTARVDKNVFPAGAAADALLKALAVCGGVRETEDDSGNAAWALASPAIMTDWPRLREFIRANSALLKTRDEVAEKARIWTSRGVQPQDLIPPGPVLEACRELLELMKGRLLPAEVDFIEASLSEEDRQLSKHLSHRIKKRLRPLVRFARSHPSLCLFGVFLLVLSQVWPLLPLEAISDLLRRLRKDFSAPSSGGPDPTLADFVSQTRRGLSKLPKPKKAPKPGDGDGQEEPESGGKKSSSDSGPDPADGNDPESPETSTAGPAKKAAELHKPTADELAREALKRIDAARKDRREPDAAAKMMLRVSLSMGMDQGAVCTGSVAVECASFSPSGAVVLTGDRDGWLRAWSNAPQGPPALVRQTQSGLGPITFLRVARSGTTVAVNERGSFRLFDSRGQPQGPVTTTVGNGVVVACVAASSDARWLALGSEAGAIRVERTGSTTQPTRLQASSGSATALAISDDGAYLACGGDGGQVEIWDVREKLLNSSLDIGARVRALAFTAGAERLIAAAADGTVKSWKRESPSDRPAHNPGRSPLAWASFDGPPGTLHGVGAEGLRVSDLEGNELAPEMHLPRGAMWPMAVSFDGRWLVARGPSDGPHVIAIGGPAVVDLELKGASGARAVAFSPAGDRIATAHDDLTLRVHELGSQQGPQKLREAGFDKLSLSGSGGGTGLNGSGGESGRGGSGAEPGLGGSAGVQAAQAAASLTKLPSPVDRLAFTTSGANVTAIVEREMMLYSWRPSSSRLVSLSCNFGVPAIRGSTAPAEGKLRLARAGGYVATLVPREAVRIWDLRGKAIGTVPVKGPPGRIDLDFDAAAGRVATVGPDGVAKLWDLSGRPISTCPSPVPSATVLAWNLAGTQLAVAGAAGGLVWELGAKDVAGRWKADNGGTEGVVFHPTEPLLAIRSRRGEISIRSLGGELAAPPIAALGIGANDGPASQATMAFSPDGRLLAYVSARRTVRFWRASLEDAVLTARTRLARLDRARESTSGP
ncbi:MAG: WD40 repeat domain-containing protein [Candidatus Wallbacteria bacterium]|nr:WD40 repeat domain-containing protein [Candidatus Wallbacteria bacterium]